MKTCPACKKESASDEECGHCGIFFSKWEVLHAAGTAAPGPPNTSAAPSGQIPSEPVVEPNIPLIQLILESIQLLTKAPLKFLALSLLPYLPIALAAVVAANRLQSGVHPMALLALGKHLIWLIPLALFLFPYALLSIVGLAHGILHGGGASLDEAMSLSFGYFPKYFAALLLYAALTVGVYTEVVFSWTPRAMLMVAGKDVEASMYTALLTPLYLFAVNFLMGTSLFPQMFFLNPDCGSLQSLNESYRHFPDITAKLKYAGFLIIVSVFTVIAVRSLPKISSEAVALPAALWLAINILASLLFLLGGTVWAASHHGSESRPLLK